MNSTERLVERPKEFNSHISHLKDKSMDELHKMFPDAPICDGVNCEMTDLDHAIFMEYEQEDINMQKKGIIKQMFLMNKNEETGEFNDIPFFEWYNGKEWVELKQ